VHPALITGPPLLTTAQAASLLNVSRRTVLNWINDDRVQYVRLPGGEYRIPLDPLLESLEGTYDLANELQGTRRSGEGEAGDGS
jgi:excisionase family DNA binding protein